MYGGDHGEEIFLDYYGLIQTSSNLVLIQCFLVIDN